MRQETELQLFQRKLEYKKLIKSIGISIEFGSDFEQFSEVPRIQPLRHKINPAFDPSESKLDSKNAIWMICRNNRDEILLTQAIKLLDLNGFSLEEYFSYRLWDFRPCGFDLDPQKMDWHLTSAAAKITGNVTYHGELWSLGGPQGIRGGCLTVLLTRLMLLEALTRWRPDFMIGFQSPMLTCRGLAAREGYLRMEQRSAFWHTKDGSPAVEGWMVWMDREEAEFNLRVPAQLFYELFENTAVSKSSSQEEIKKSA